MQWNTKLLQIPAITLQINNLFQRKIIKNASEGHKNTLYNLDRTLQIEFEIKLNGLSNRSLLLRKVWPYAPPCIKGVEHFEFILIFASLTSI